VLWHGGWLQAIPPRDTPVPLLIQTGHRWEDVFELEGTVAVTLGRYLHFQTKLLFHQPLLGEAPAPQPVAPEGEVAAQGMDQADAEAEPPPGADAAVIDSALNPASPRFMVLDESRRMRSSELHYLDHPKLGVLVRIEPVEPPEALVEAYLALEESSE